jgi:phage terminase small subunit
MPILSNARHERFAQALAAGKTADEAYQQAGYKQSRPAASRLSTNVNVKARVAELLNKSALKADVTRETIADMLRADRTLARELSQVGAAVRAAESLGKLYGHYVEHKSLTIDDKRSPTDWGRDELVAFLNDAKAGSGRAAKANGRGGEPDSVH